MNITDPRVLVAIEKRKQLALKATKVRLKPPKWLYPSSVEREYTFLLQDFVKEIEQATRNILFPALSSLENEANRNKPKTDDWTDNVNELVQKMSLTLDQSKYDWNLTSINIGQKVSKWNSLQWQKTLKSVLGLGTVQYEPWIGDQLKSFSKENVTLIKGLKEKTLSDIEGLAQRSLRAGIRHEQIQKEITEQFGVAKRRATLIARDQVSKLNGQLTQLRQQDAGISKYIWQTSDDERTRGKPGGHYASSKPSHWALEGKTCRWDDATVFLEEKTGKWIKRSTIGGVEKHPGQDIQCRCWAEPIFDDVYSEVEKVGKVKVPAKKEKVEKLAEVTPANTEKVLSPMMKVADFKKTYGGQSILQIDNRTDERLLGTLHERLQWYYNNFKSKYDSSFKFTVQGIENDDLMGSYLTTNYQAKVRGNEKARITLKLGKHSRNFDWMTNQLIKDVKAKYHPIGTDSVKATIDHEMGHVLTRRYLGEDFQKDAQKLYDKYSAIEIKKGLGQYGANNYSEFVSEGWAEYLNNSDPRPIAKEIGSLINKYWKRYYGQTVGSM